nr:SMI1/KNR4 family protein [Treponema sp.]
MTLKDFVEQYEDVEKLEELVTEEFLEKVEETLNLKFGNKLKNYILDFGYLAFEYVEFYGINPAQGFDSDLITQTQYLHKSFPQTYNLIAFENQGDGDYFLVDENDKMFEFDSVLKELKCINQNLEEYILDRFNTVLAC